MFRLKICHDLRTFWRSLGKKKCLFGSKTVFLGQEVLYYMVYIAYFTELILQVAITRKNDTFGAKIVNTRWTKIVMASFAPHERLPSSATLNVIHICAQLVQI